MVRLPSVSVAAERVVAPRVTAMVPPPAPSEVTVAVNGVLVAGALPSPGSTAHVPENVALLVPAFDPPVARPWTTMLEEGPSNVVSTEPFRPS